MIGLSKATYITAMFWTAREFEAKLTLHFYFIDVSLDLVRHWPVLQIHILVAHTFKLEDSFYGLHGC